PRCVWNWKLQRGLNPKRNLPHLSCRTPCCEPKKLWFFRRYAPMSRCRSTNCSNCWKLNLPPQRCLRLCLSLKFRGACAACRERITCVRCDLDLFPIGFTETVCAILRTFECICAYCCRHAWPQSHCLPVETKKPSVLASNFRGCFPKRKRATRASKKSKARQRNRMIRAES